MNNQKEQIINHLLNHDFHNLEKSFHHYEQTYPFDVDMYLLKGFFYLCMENQSEARKYLLLSRKHNYYDVDTWFLLGELNTLEKNYLDAIEYYSFANTLNTYFKQQYLFYEDSLCMKKIDAAQQLLDVAITSYEDIMVAAIKKQLQGLNYKLGTVFNLFDDIIRSPKNAIGEIFFFPQDKKRFCAYYHPTSAYLYDSFEIKSLNLTKGELLKIYDEGNIFSLDTKETFLLPIASKEIENKIQIQSKTTKESITAQIVTKNHFNYFRIDDDVTIETEKPVILGEPVPLQHDASRKKLVISLFVDGISQKLLQEEGLQQVMPNTYAFFSKGMMCENFFTTSDWTYPSLASFVTGYTLPQHMMFHPILNKPLPEDTKTVFEYLKDGGYYTTMINGDWRSSGTYGYTQGIDRYVAQNGLYYRMEQGISDAIEHIDAFRETDQYLWITAADLHDIADEYDLATGIQTQLPLSARQTAEKSLTSVKQNYSPQKRTAYIRALQMADLRFQSLYDYIESHYEEEEFIVTLFGDHGQTYLLPPEEHHLARYHSNVGFMVRGGGYTGTCKEYMSAVDYPNILCKLANVGTAVTGTEGQLPKVFGGEKERAFTITETIHPNDPYMVSLHGKDHTFYLTTENVITNDGRLASGSFTANLVDAEGKQMERPELVDYYINYLREHLKYILQY